MPVAQHVGDSELGELLAGPNGSAGTSVAGRDHTVDSNVFASVCILCSDDHAGMSPLLCCTSALQASGINQKLPPVSYTKAIDVWINVCLGNCVCTDIQISDCDISIHIWGTVGVRICHLYRGEGFQVIGVHLLVAMCSLKDEKRSWQKVVSQRNSLHRDLLRKCL